MLHVIVSTRLWAVLGTVFLLWILTGPTHTPTHRSLGISITILLYFVAAGAIARSARTPAISKAFGKGLRWIALSQVLYGIGTLCGFLTLIYEPGHKARFDSADVFFLAAYPAIMLGLIFMPGVERPTASRSRILVDSAVFLAGVGLPVWLFTLGPGLSNASLFDGTMFVAYPVAIFSGITTLNLILLTRAPLPSRGAFGLLVSAICVLWLADLIYLLDSVQGVIAKGPVDWSNASSALSAVLFILAAKRIGTKGTSDPRQRQAATSSPLPIITIVAVSGWLVLFMVRGHPDTEVMTRILACLVLLFLVLSVREAFVFRDNTRWLEGEIEREARDRFEILVQHSSDVIMLVDSEYKISFASPAVAAALDVTVDHIAGQPILSLVHELDLAKGAAFLDAVANPSEVRSSVRWRLRRADRSYRIFDTLGSRVERESSLQGMVITSRDVTEQVELDEKVQQAQKLEALGQLVGGIAHNFNNILTATMMRLGMLRAHAQLSPEVLDEVQALDKEARRSAELTRKLVLFGSQHFTNASPVNVWESLTRLEPQIRRLLGDQIQLHITGGSSPRVVMADLELIDHMIMVVCSNARDAMPEGGYLIIEVTDLSADQLPVDREGAARPEHVMRISFQDNGCGMDSSVMQHLYEPFFTTKGPTGEHGLGLASVHGAVKRHKGWMQVESTPGKGSTFRIFLPCSSASSAASAA